MSENINNEDDTLNAKPLPLWAFFIIFLYGTAIFAVLIILPSGDMGWIEGWAYILLFMGLNITYYIRINKKNPAVIRNRMKFKKTGVSDEIKKEAGSDRWIMVIMGFTGVSTWVLPGLNKRFSWSSIPLSVEIVGFILGIIGIIIFLKAQEQNAYASKLLDINKDQKLIDTGLYSHVRHPLYSGAIIWIIGTPIALGMWLDLIPAILFCLTLVLRIKYEEEMLIKGMEGYEDYKTRVKYKLFPKIY